MVAFPDISRVNALYAELSRISVALGMFDTGHVITAFGIGPKRDPESSQPVPPPFMVPAAYMETPPQMLETIKTLLQQRQDRINSELEALGVTGVEAPQRAAEPGRKDK